MNDITTGNIFAADGTLSTTLRVVTAGEAKAIEASVPKGLYVSHIDSSTTIGLNIVVGKSASTYSSTSITTNKDKREKR